MTEPTAANPRTARREAARRKRLRIGIAGSIAAVLAAVGGVVVLAGGGGEEKPARKAAPAPTTTTIPPTTTTTVPPPALTATTNVPSLQVFEAPGSTRVVTSLSAKTEYLQPRTLLVLEDQGEWLKTLLPIRPNGSTGFVRKSDVTLSTTPYQIRINLAEHKLVLLKDGKEVLSSATVNGAPRTPTPPGTYYITDPVDLRSNPNGDYGAYALGISGFSEVLFEFMGGPGQLAVHGTPRPQDMGTDISNGCIRVPNEVITEIARQVPLGTPVIIV